MKKGQRGLGKGLDALFADNAVETTNGGTVTLRISEIEPNKAQPRRKFDEEALSQLSDSIREHGILQPLVVRPLPGSGNYQLVAGERRWRAARMAGLSEVPVLIRELSDTETFEIALIENLQREDLNPIEEAEGYRSLMDNFEMTQDEVSKIVGKSRPAVTNALRLLNLPASVLKMVEEGTLSQGHARALLAVEDPDVLEKVAQEAAAHGLSVREVEKLVKKLVAAPLEEAAASKPAAPDQLLGEIQRGLAESLGRKVKIAGGKKHGTLQIEYYGEDDLRTLANALSRPNS